MTWHLVHLVAYVGVAILVYRELLGWLCDWLERDIAALGVELAESRLERIARLEMSLGMGLQWDGTRELVAATPIAVRSDIYKKLAEEGNGAVSRACWGCEKDFKPHSEYAYGAAWYQLKDGPDFALISRLCPRCYEGSLAEIASL